VELSNVYAVKLANVAGLPYKTTLVNGSWDVGDDGIRVFGAAGPGRMSVHAEKRAGRSQPTSENRRSALSLERPSDLSKRP
jgi:hypothetical protein